jgi:hypothetical protein
MEHQKRAIDVKQMPKEELPSTNFIREDAFLQKHLHLPILWSKKLAEDRIRVAHLRHPDRGTDECSLPLYTINTFVFVPGVAALRGLYVAGDATNSLPENQRLLGGGAAQDIRLFPTAGGGAEGGLFGDPYQGFVELEYSPNKAFALRLQYSGGRVFGSSFNGFGVNFDLALSQRLGLFGRYGYASIP